MFNFFKKKSPRFAEQLKAITDINETLRYYLWFDLKEQYKKEMDKDLAGLLAGRVLNYLMGDDLEKVYKGLSLDVQKRSNEIKDLVQNKVEEAMIKNNQVRELIIRHLMTFDLIGSFLFDKEWWDKVEIKNRDHLIKKYCSNGIEIPEAENFDKYMAFAINFIQTRKQLEEHGRGIK